MGQKSVFDLDGKVRAQLAAYGITLKQQVDECPPAVQRLFTKFFKENPDKKDLCTGTVLENLNALRTDSGIPERKSAFVVGYHSSRSHATRRKKAIVPVRRTQSLLCMETFFDAQNLPSKSLNRTHIVEL